MHQDTEPPKTPNRGIRTARIVTFAVLATPTILIGAIDAL